MGEKEKAKNPATGSISKDEIIAQLQNQNKYLIQELQKQNEAGFYKRLDYLFKVVENAKLFAEVDKDFLLKSVAEIVSVITIPEEENKEENTESTEPENK